MKKLISMTDFVLEQSEILHKEKNRNFNLGLLDFTTDLIKYARFLKQPLELYMFVPCDENNIPLKKQTMYYSEEYIGKLKGIEVEVAKLVNRKISDYYFAKKRCLFEEFIYDGFKYIECKNYCINISNLPKLTIEHLIKHNLTLTETAIKLFK